MSPGSQAHRPLFTYAVVTLGCRANQYDGAAMAADLSAQGLIAAAPELADVVVVNTCMVTEATETQCRKLVHRVRRVNSKARLVVAGCLPGGRQAEVRSWGSVELVLAPFERGSLSAGLGLSRNAAWSTWPPEPAVQGEERTRAILKVQDGCDSRCSFCVVPSLRGPSRSLPTERVLRAIEDLTSRGVPEVVLSGVHLGAYGADLLIPVSLSGLLGKILASRPSVRVRLSSIEPMEVTDDLLSVMSSAEGRICRHLHMPLQSGSDRVLEAMGRPYTAETYARAVARSRKALPGIGIGCDVICGFPGETDGDFARTEDLVRTLGIPFVHVFPFSSRPGTAAAALADDVPPKVKRERVRRIRLAASRNLHGFLESFVGATLEAVVERFGKGRGRFGLTDNYLKVRLTAGSAGAGGRRIAVRCAGRSGDCLTAEPLSEGSHG